MHPLGYYEIMRISKDQKIIRLKMVKTAKEKGVKPTARLFNSTPKTVRKWLRRYEESGYEGLKDQSKAPKNPAVFITEEQKQEVIKLKKQHPSWGARRMKEIYGLSISDKAIRKIWKQEGLIRKKKKKHVKKHNLRKKKAKWRAFEQIDFDTKYLNDIPEYYTQMKKFKLPKIQYTARDVSTGALFLGYADEISLNYASLFLAMVLKHLKHYNVNLEGTRIQTDNGSEFIGSWNARKDSIFTRIAEATKGVSHHTIPPGAHTWQSDVETVHSLMEDEFYEVEKFRSKKNFMAKATAYNLWFNIARTNTYKESQTPLQIIQNKDNKINPYVTCWIPVMLNELFFSFFDDITKKGYDVVPLP